MKTVVCWCCEYFKCFDKLKILDQNLINGKCEFTNSFRFSENDVCEDFILRSGLVTKRKIPDICKKYKSTFCDTENQ